MGKWIGESSVHKTHSHLSIRRVEIGVMHQHLKHTENVIFAIFEYGECESKVYTWCQKLIMWFIIVVCMCKTKSRPYKPILAWVEPSENSKKCQKMPIKKVIFVIFDHVQCDCKV